jgi:polyisoprenoid-binding protein YceI
MSRNFKSIAAVTATVAAGMILAGSVFAQDDKPNPQAQRQAGDQKQHVENAKEHGDHDGHDHAGHGHDAPAAPGKLTFKAQNKVHKADGSFSAWRFTEVNIPDGNATKATVTLEIDLGSVDAGNPKLSGHLKTPDFFDVPKFPKATVKIHDAKSTGENTYTATADLTLVGMTKSFPVEFKVTSQEPLTISGTCTVKRSEFNMYSPYDPANDRSPEDEVKVALEGVVAVAK